MAQYQFVNKETKQTVNLSEVDAYACELSGDKVNDERYSAAYQGMISWMFAAFMNVNDWNNARALRWLKKYAENNPHDIVLLERDTETNETKELPLVPTIEKILDRYTMRAWRK